MFHLQIKDKENKSLLNGPVISKVKYTSFEITRKNRPCLMKNTTSQNLSNNFRDCVDISHPNVALTISIYLCLFTFLKNSCSVFFLFERLWDGTFLSIDCHENYWSRNCQENFSEYFYLISCMGCCCARHLDTCARCPNDDGILIWYTEKQNQHWCAVTNL